MRSIDDLFDALSRSTFRARFRLGAKERNYLQSKGLPVVMTHAADFIDARLGPASPPNDGKQTPMRGHPVFVAQHATATCCRGCLAKWHNVPKGRTITGAERAHVLDVIRHWLERETRDKSQGEIKSR